LKKALPLKDYLLFLNSDEVHQRDHGQYLLYISVGSKDNPVGADLWLSRWYNRNVRIFANVQRIADQNDRILLIFGNGHMHSLKTLFTTSREFDPVNLTIYLE